MKVTGSWLPSTTVAATSTMTLRRARASEAGRGSATAMRGFYRRAGGIPSPPVGPRAAVASASARGLSCVGAGESGHEAERMQAPELASGADRAIRRRDNPRGIACLVAGIAIFSLQDLILKLLSGDYPLHQAMVLRSVTALPILLGFVAMGGGLRRLLTPGWPVLVLRGLILFAAYTSYYLGLAALPMATTVTLSFVAPLFITALSVVVLGERVGPRRWLAVAAGLGGVMLMVRPGSTLFDWAALLPVFCGLAYGLSMVTARSLGIRQSAAVMAFYGNLVFLAGAVAMALAFGGEGLGGGLGGGAHASLGFLVRGWAAPSARDLALMLSCGVIAAAGLTLLTEPTASPRRTWWRRSNTPRSSGA